MKASQILLKLYVCKSFFFPRWAEEIIDLCGKVEIDRRHRYKGKIFYRKPFISNSCVVVQKSVVSCYAIIPFHPGQGRPLGAQMKTV